LIFNGLLILAGITAIFTLLPLWRFEAWWVRSLDFPRLQLLCISFILLLADILLLNFAHLKVWLLFGLGIFCLIYHAWWILPYTRIWRPEVTSAKKANRRQSIRIMTANVLMTNRKADALIELVHENSPDVLVTLETDAWWQSRLDVLASDYAYTLKCPLDNLYGMHVYAKIPLIDSRIEYLVEPDIPSIHTAAIMPTGNRIRMHFLHPAPPSPTENQESSERDAELIIVAKSVADTDAPVIVTGDLNDVAWSETTRLFRKISGLLDPRVGRGMFNTFHADYWFIRWPLDHLFHSRHFYLARMRRLKRFGSDHFAILTELVLISEDNGKQNGLTADKADIAWADQKANHQGVNQNDVPQPGHR
jgi:endonuclease/exonuclease/phosphatase (EEP) superfamily protein YafD